MKRLLACALLAATTGCASIVDGSDTESVTVSSNPSGAHAQIRNLDSGDVVHEATTPFSVNLNRGEGYFDGADYVVTISADGYQPTSLDIESRATGWYIAGNLLFGGIVGWLIIDPATGAMWTLDPDKINAELVAIGDDKKVSQAR